MTKKKNKEKIYRLILILGGIIILILILFFLGKLPSPEEKAELIMPIKQQSKTQTTQEKPYPHNLIEGIILEIDRSKPGSFLLEANTLKISTAKAPSMEKTIKLTQKTEIVLYDMTTKKESPFKFSELEVGNNLVIETEESTHEKVNELDEFTATKISKYVDYPGE